MKYRMKDSQELAAAKAGIDPKTARKYEKAGKFPSEMKPSRTWRTREDPFEGRWREIEEMLSQAPGLEAKTIQEWLIEREPERFNWTQLRTLQRRVRDWRALHGPEKEVMFAQKIQPGRQSQSDFTWMNALQITIAGQLFRHLLFHFILPYSHWESVSICFSESFESLVAGYERAVWQLGGVAGEHRTDNLSAATQPAENGRSFTAAWQEVMRHYRVKPTRNNPGLSHENGSIEKSHDLFKKAVHQQLLLRGCRDFVSREAYETFLEEVRQRRHRGKEKRLAEELALLQPLPSRKWNGPRILQVRVNPFSLIRIDKETYSVPSRLIGHQLRALVYPGKVALYYGRTLIETMPRVSPDQPAINYRHLVAYLLRKPGAFLHYQYRDCCFPQLVFRQAWEMLLARSPAQASKEYLKVLHLAAIGSEQEVSLALELLLAQQQLPTVEAVKALLDPPHLPIPPVDVKQPQLSSYDTLLESLL